MFGIKYLFLTAYFNELPKKNTMILVTGATGFLGAELIHQLTSQNIQVRALKRKTSKIPDLIAANQLVEWFVADINEPEDLADACLLAVEHNAEGVFHISGKDMMSVVELVKRVADFYKLDQSLIIEVNSASLNQAAKRPLIGGLVSKKFLDEYPNFHFSNVDDLQSKVLDKGIYYYIASTIGNNSKGDLVKGYLTIE